MLTIPVRSVDAWWDHLTAPPDPRYAALAVLELLGTATRAGLGLEDDSDGRTIDADRAIGHLVSEARSRGDDETARLLQRARRAAYRALAGRSEAYEELTTTARAVTEHLGVRDRLVELHSPTEGRVANSTPIDSPHGVRFFELVHGHVSLMDADLLVTSSPLGPEPPHGAVISALRNVHGLELKKDAVYLRGGDDLEVLFEPVPASLPFRAVMTVRFRADGSDELNGYRRAVRSLFAALAALEYEGSAFERIGMSTLGANRLSDYDGLVGVLIEEAGRWLRSSAKTQHVTVVVPQLRNLVRWSEAMDRRLGRTMSHDARSRVVRELAAELLPLLARHTRGPLASAAVELDACLRRPDDLAFDRLAVFARKYTELVAKARLHEASLSHRGILLNDIETLREARIAAPWVTSYMHQLRIFGNEGVHPRTDAVRFSPPTPGSLDVIGLLVALRAIAGFWEESSVGSGGPDS